MTDKHETSQHFFIHEILTVKQHFVNFTTLSDTKGHNISQHSTYILSDSSYKTSHIG